MNTNLRRRHTKIPRTKENYNIDLGREKNKQNTIKIILIQIEKRTKKEYDKLHTVYTNATQYTRIHIHKLMPIPADINTERRPA